MLITGFHTISMFAQVGFMIYQVKFSVQMLEIITTKKIEGYMQLGVIPNCMVSNVELHECNGGAIEWLIIDAIILFLYAFTMFMLVLKSRFITIGVN